MLNGALRAGYRRWLRDPVRMASFGWVVHARRARHASGVAPSSALEHLPAPGAYVPIAVRRPDFLVERPPQTALLRDFLANPNLRPYQPAVVRVRDALVQAPSMVHRWRGIALLEGLLDDPRNIAYPRPLFEFETLGLRRASRHRAGLLLALPLHTNFYHWLIEQLPRLLWLEQVPGHDELPLLVPRSAPRFVVETLARAGLQQRVQWLDAGAHRFDELVLPGLLSPPSHPSPLAVDWLQRHLPTGCLPGRRRLYISRRDAPTRFATNEDEVFALLARHGFERVAMSEHDTQAQARLFAEAEIIVGLHGAALTNLAFCHAGTRVVELFQQGWFTNAFYHLALIRGMRYGYVVCPVDGAGQRVPMAELESVLLQALRG